jgi:oligosaccharide 4-alpha-D-glucosyltransferase
LQPGEKIFGTGERSIPINRRGFKLNLYNNPWYGYSMNADNLNYSVPFIISSRGYAIFFDNPSKGYLDIGKSTGDILEYGASSGELTFYVIPGKSVDEIMKKYHQLTGTQPLPPRWAFGNLMSRFGYRSEDHLMSIYQKMKQENIPVDAIIIDLFWFGDSIKGTMGNLDWVNRKAWPNPAGMINALKKENVKTILITEPFILKTTANYEPSKKYHAVDSNGETFCSY